MLRGEEITLGQERAVTARPRVSCSWAESPYSNRNKIPRASALEQWEAIVASPWMIRMIRSGYTIQISSAHPVFIGVISSRAQGESACVLWKEILSILSKGAISVIPPVLSQNGFYSRYFLVPKGMGDIHPILDLHALNRYLRKYRFRMLMHASLLRLLLQSDWFTSVDLKDCTFTSRYIHLTESSFGSLFRGCVMSTACSPLASL